MEVEEAIAKKAVLEVLRTSVIEQLLLIRRNQVAEHRVRGSLSIHSAIIVPVFFA
jgi:hypothetical protein